MSNFDLIDAVVYKTSEDVREIRRHGFMLTGPQESGSDLDPECMVDLIDLPKTGAADWVPSGLDAVSRSTESR